jgi:hypothetical protein
MKIIRKIAPKCCLVTVQYVTAAAQVQQHNWKGYEKKMTTRLSHRLGFDMNMATGDLAPYSGLLLGRGLANLFLFLLPWPCGWLRHWTVHAGSGTHQLAYRHSWCLGNMIVILLFWTSRSEELFPGDHGRLLPSALWLPEEWPPEGGGHEKRTGMISIHLWPGVFIFRFDPPVRLSRGVLRPTFRSAWRLPGESATAFIS